MVKRESRDSKGQDPSRNLLRRGVRGARKESPEECARRTAAFPTLLAPSDPLLFQWYLPTRTSRGGVSPL
ncbi:Imm52 family immunity protein [Corallococcus exiguus]|uniref:Imm52 family immunity protein n=1 Tax=Corallococcus TaxID=83461 RepID=UPI003211C2C1